MVNPQETTPDKPVYGPQTAQEALTSATTREYEAQEVLEHAAFVGDAALREQANHDIEAARTDAGIARFHADPELRAAIQQKLDEAKRTPGSPLHSEL